MAVDSNPYLAQAALLEQDLIRWRRDFHQHPELGFNEQRSAAVIAQHLAGLPFQVETGIAGTGIAATLTGGSPGPAIMLRFDMDALPIQERHDVPYASTTPGVMHACGHDGHMAIGMGVASLLAGMQRDLAGRVALVFQPAEEGEGGAQRMIACGLLDRLKPDLALGIHIWNELPLDTLAVTPGAAMAGADRFRIQLHGQGGHAALPQRAVDPIPAAAAVIQACQTIPSRATDPLETIVLSLTMVHGGEAFNIIPDVVEMEGTLRFFSSEVREQAISRLRELVAGTAAAYGCSAEFELDSIAPAVFNQPQLARQLADLTADAFPDYRLLRDFRVMGSEDMAFFLEHIPGCYLFLGSSNPDSGLSSAHHSPDFDFDEQVLVTGTAWLAGLVQKLLEAG